LDDATLNKLSEEGVDAVGVLVKVKAAYEEV
jgi:hypothetical protein